MSKATALKRKLALLRQYEHVPEDPNDCVTTSRALLVAGIAARVALEVIAEAVLKTGKALSEPAPSGYEASQVEQRVAAHYQRLRQLHETLQYSLADDREKEGRSAEVQS